MASSLQRKLRSASFRDLQREMSRRQRGIQTLSRRRDRFLDRVHAIDEQIRMHGGTIRTPHGKQSKNSMTLDEALLKVLKGKKMTIDEASQAVKKSGYKTKANGSFPRIVNARLTNTKLFSRVERGTYTAK